MTKLRQAFVSTLQRFFDTRPDNEGVGALSAIIGFATANFQIYSAISDQFERREAFSSFIKVAASQLRDGEYDASWNANAKALEIQPKNVAALTQHLQRGRRNIPEPSNRAVTSRSHTRCSACKSSCSTVFVATNFMVGRCTASAPDCALVAGIQSSGRPLSPMIRGLLKNHGLVIAKASSNTFRRRPEELIGEYRLLRVLKRHYAEGSILLRRE